MTDKVQKIREDVEMVVNRRLNLLNGDYFDLIEETDGLTNEIMDIIDSLQEEPVSNDLEGEIVHYIGFPQEIDEDVSTTMIRKAAHHFANWQKEQFEKNRLAACDAQTKEEAEREMNFATNIIKKEHRTPTYDDAIKYGMRLKKEEMMAKAIDAKCFGFQGAALFSFRLPADKYLVGSKVKVIVVKEE